MAASTMPVAMDTHLPVEDDEAERRTSGIEITRPFPNVVKLSHGLGCLLIAVGIAEVIVGSVLFKDWQIVGGFWVGFVASAAGVTGTCVSVQENSGGFPTALFCFQSALCIVAATLSLVLVDGLAYTKVRDSDGNCVETSSCSDNICGGYDCVCWAPDGSTDCSNGESQRMCLTYNGKGNCEHAGDSEALLLASTIFHVVIDALAVAALIVAFATCCCCKYTVLLRREEGVTRVHRVG